jgi:PAS domain-containing protein
MAGRLREHDWAATKLGPPDRWSSSLKVMVRMALTTRHPIFIFWGSEHTCFYNDAYSPSLGPEKHPSMLGAPGREAWHEIWHIIGPQIEFVMRGEGATWHENHLVPFLRNGAMEEVYWTYSYGPIDDESAPNGVGGVLVVCNETTHQVMAERVLVNERERFAWLFEQAPSFMAFLQGPEHLVELANPGYMKLIGHRPILGRTIAEALPDAVAQGYLRLLDKVYASGEAVTASGARYVHTRLDATEVERFVDFVYQPI